MNFRRTAWGVGLLGALALLGCGGDDTPTPNGREGEAGIAGAGGAGPDATVVGTGGSAGGAAGASVTDAGMVCTTPSMSVNTTNINACKAAVAEAGAGDDDASASCATCLCNKDPVEAKACAGNLNCKALECWRASCKCPSAAPEAGSDAPASDGGGNEASTTDGPASDGAAE